MTDFEELVSDLLYDETDEQVAKAVVDIEIKSIRDRDEDLLHAIHRIEGAVENEIQAVQDEIDEYGEVSDA